MRRTSYVALLIGGIVMVSLSGRAVQAQDPAAKDGGAECKSNRSGAMESETNRPYFRMDAEARRSFAATVQTLKLGDCRQSVESLLGKPWSDQRATTKETRKFIGRFVEYYLTKNRKDTVNEKLDEWVMLKFDANDHLVKIVSRAADIPSRP